MDIPNGRQLKDKKGPMMRNEGNCLPSFQGISIAVRQGAVLRILTVISVYVLLLKQPVPQICQRIILNGLFPVQVGNKRKHWKRQSMKVLVLVDLVLSLRHLLIINSVLFPKLKMFLIKTAEYGSTRKCHVSV